MSWELLASPLSARWFGQGAADHIQSDFSAGQAGVKGERVSCPVWVLLLSQDVCTEQPGPSSHLCGRDGNLICTESLLASVLPLPGGQVGRGGAHQGFGQGGSAVGPRRHPAIHLSHLFTCPTCLPVSIVPPVHLSYLFIYLACPLLTCSSISPVPPIHLSHLFTCPTCLTCPHQRAVVTRCHVCPCTGPRYW